MVLSICESFLRLEELHTIIEVIQEVVILGVQGSKGNIFTHSAMFDPFCESLRISAAYHHFRWLKTSSVLIFEGTAEFLRHTCTVTKRAAEFLWHAVRNGAANFGGMRSQWGLQNFCSME